MHSPRSPSGAAPSGARRSVGEPQRPGGRRCCAEADSQSTPVTIKTTARVCRGLLGVSGTGDGGLLDCGISCRPVRLLYNGTICIADGRPGARLVPEIYWCQSCRCRSGDGSPAVVQAAGSRPRQPRIRPAAGTVFPLIRGSHPATDHRLPVVCCYRGIRGSFTSVAEFRMPPTLAGPKDLVGGASCCMY